MDWEAVEKVRKYRSGSEFMIYWTQIPKEKHGAMHRLLMYCWEEEKLIEPISTGLGWDANGEFTTLEEKWRRV